MVGYFSVCSKAETKTEKWKIRKKNKKNEKDMPRSIGNSPGSDLESVESVLKKKKKGYSGTDLRKRKSIMVDVQ